MENIIGRKLDGRYEIQEILGIGGMAIVYKAYDSIDDRVVAVKVLKEEYLTNEDFKRRFRNESKAIAVLSHPNIVKVYDVSLGEKIQYIVMEYVDGITLKEYIDQQQVLTWKEAVHFTVQILRALQHAHDKGIVHRDIKPQNIMMLEDGTIKVADFGIARFANSETRTMTDKAIGSVHYISPEQARGAETDEKSDIYSVGVMLYEMLTGRLPFDSENAVSVAIMQMQQEPRRPRELNDRIPEGLEDITLRAMQKDPLLRYPSAVEMLEDIDQFKRNPTIHFEYKYFVDESPTKYVDAINKIKGTQEKEEPVPVKKKEEKKKPKKASVIPILSAVAAAVLIVALALILWAMNMFGIIGGKNSGNIKVPSVKGKMYADVAANTSISKNFIIVKSNTRFDPTPAGTILQQDPAAGESAKPHTQLKLTVSLGPQTAKVTKVDGLSQSDAQVALHNDGFNFTITQQNSTTVTKGQVIKTDPAGGSTAPYGSTVTIFVSAGAPNVTIPGDVVGKLEADAKTELSGQGLSVSPSVYQYSDTVATGHVISVSPNPGTSAQANSKVTLTVSNGPPQPSAPTSQSISFTLLGLPNSGSGFTISLSFETGQDSSNLYRIANNKAPVIKTSSQSGSHTVTIIVNGTDDSGNVYNDVTYKQFTVNFSTSDSSVTITPDSSFKAAKNSPNTQGT